MQKLGKMAPSSGTSKGKGKQLLIGVLSVFALLVASLVGIQKTINFSSTKQAAPADAGQGTQYAGYEAFAKKVCIAMNNISFNNLSPDADGKIPYFEMLNPYFDQKTLFKLQNDFMSADHQQKVVVLKLFCTAEKVNAISSEPGDQGVIVWLTGSNQYASLTKHSTTNIPYSIKLVIQKAGNDFKVVDFILAQDRS